MLTGGTLGRESPLLLKIDWPIRGFPRVLLSRVPGPEPWTTAAQWIGGRPSGPYGAGYPPEHHRPPNLQYRYNSSVPLVVGRGGALFKGRCWRHTCSPRQLSLNLEARRSPTPLSSPLL